MFPDSFFFTGWGILYPAVSLNTAFSPKNGSYCGSAGISITPMGIRMANVFLMG